MFVGRHGALGFIHDKLESPVEESRVKEGVPLLWYGD